MKKLIITLALMLFTAPVIVAQEVVSPDQGIQNTKSYTGINYNRQDSEQVGTQRIVNDHSWFNINIQIIKKGALFKSKNVIVGSEKNSEK